MTPSFLVKSSLTPSLNVHISYPLGHVSKSLLIQGTNKFNYSHIRGIATTKPITEGSVPNKPPASPLSKLSNTTILRSVFLSTISSTSWLLTPSIYILSLLCRPKPPLLLNIRRNKPLAWITKRVLYNQFCAGETEHEVKANMKRMRELGFNGTILTYAQETVFDHNQDAQIARDSAIKDNDSSKLVQDVKVWRDATLKTIEMLGEGDQLAIKMTGAGSAVNEYLTAEELPPKPMLDALYEISQNCRDRKVCLVIDAESQHYQAGIHKVGLHLTRKYNKDGQTVIYNTYQAYLKSTPSTLGHHLKVAYDENFTLGIKLVRGAYLSTDPRKLIHDTKQDTDNAYNRIAHGLLSQQVFDFGIKGGLAFPSVDVILAGHNQESIFSAYNLHQKRLKEGLPTVPLGFAQLQGMADEISLSLVQMKGDSSRGPRIHKCSTWGSLEDCLSYLYRRATENREAASRTVDGLKALISEVKRRMSPSLPGARQSRRERVG